MSDRGDRLGRARSEPDARGVEDRETAVLVRKRRIEDERPGSGQRTSDRAYQYAVQRDVGRLGVQATHVAGAEVGERVGTVRVARGPYADAEPGLVVGAELRAVHRADGRATVWRDAGGLTISEAAGARRLRAEFLRPSEGTLEVAELVENRTASDDDQPLPEGTHIHEQAPMSMRDLGTDFSTGVPLPKKMGPRRWASPYSERNAVLTA